MNKWLETLKSAEKTCMAQDGKKKIHYTFPDNTEMVEEYSVANGEILTRKWRRKNTFGSAQPWEFEIGSDEIQKPIGDVIDISESSSNPVFVRQDNIKLFQWRIRNLPYTIDNYDISLDEQQRQITIRTQNKKYFKKFNITDLDRLEIPLEKRLLTYAHSNNTLILSYEKPSSVIDIEKQIFKTSASNKEGDIDCKPS